MKIVKVMLAALAAAAVLLAAAVAVIVWRFDPNDYRSYVVDWVEQRTGRSFAVAGDLELELFPRLAIEAGGVTVGNAEGFDESQPFATAARIAAELEVLPLLGRRVEIGTIRLDGLRLNLARDGGGRGNWEDLATGRDTSAPGGEDPGGRFGTLDIEGLLIRDAALYWHEDIDRLRYVAEDITIETGAIGGGAPIDATFAVNVLDVESQRTFRVEAASRVLLGAALESAAAVGAGSDGGIIELQGFRLDLAVLAAADAEPLGRGRLEADSVRAASSGRVAIDAARIDAQLPSLAAAPGLMDAAAAWSAAVFEPATGTVGIEGLTTRFAGVESSWQLSARNVIDAPALDGTLRIDSASIADVLSAAGLAAPGTVDPAALGTVGAEVAFGAALEPASADSSSDAAAFDGWRIGPYRLASARISGLDARGLGIAVQGAAELANGTSLRGTIEVPATEPSTALIALLEAYAPGGIDPSALGPVALSGTVEADLEDGSFTVRDFEAALAGTRVTGSLDTQPQGSGHVYRGTLAASRFDGTALAQLAGDMLPAALAPERFGMVAVDAGFVYTPESDRLTLAPLSLEAFGLSARGEAAITNLNGGPQAAGRARVTAFSPRELMRRFGLDVPATADPAALRHAAVDTRFDVGAGGGQFTNVELALDDSRITGDFAIDGFDDPAYSFTLAIDRVDADRYLPPRGPDLPEDADEDAPTAGDIELPTEALGSLDVTGRVSVGALQLAGLEFADVSTGIGIGNGEATLDSAHARLYGGEFDGSFHVTTTNGEPGLALRGKATGISIEPIIVGLTGDANFSGTGDFELDLSGRGPTVTANVQSANGSVAFAMRDGAIRGFNLGRTLCALYNSTQRLPAPPAQPDVTAFESISGTASVTDGTAASRDVLARTSFMEVEGAGSLGLAEQRLDYDLEAKLTGSIDIAGCQSMDPLIGGSIPFTLRGTVTDPEIRPDFGEIIQRRLRDELQDRVRDRIRDLLQ